MALGNTGYANDGRFLALRLRNKKVDPETKKEIPLNPPLFEVSEKVNEKWTVREKMENRVGGDLVHMKLETDEYEGNEYNIVKLFLRDENEKETYLLDLRYTNLTRNIFNSLLALDSYENLSVSLYKKVGKDGKEYPNVSLWQGKTLVKGKFAWDDLPKPQEIKVNKKVVRDFTELDEFYVTELKKLVTKVNSKGKSAPVDNSNDSPASEPEEVAAGGEDTGEDIPF